MRLVLALLFLTACPSAIAPTQHDAADGAPSACAQACAKLAAWACPEAQPTPTGESCESFCMRTSSLVDPACVTKANTVDDLAGCEVRCIK